MRVIAVNINYIVSLGSIRDKHRQIIRLFNSELLAEKFQERYLK
jgi:hypothetical protein